MANLKKTFCYPIQSSYFYIQKFCLILLLLICRSRLTYCQTVECRDVNLNPIACLPGPENIVRGRPVTISPDVSTCGSPASRYCRPRPRNGCFFCNNSNPSTSHGPEKMIDSYNPPSGFWDLGAKPTWWQSITWWDARQRGLLIDNTVKVNVTFSFNKTFVITGDITVTFYSAKPKAVIIERSNDSGRTWMPYSYFADNCNSRFATPILKKTSAITVDNFRAYCVEATNPAAEQVNSTIPKEI